MMTVLFVGSFFPKGLLSTVHRDCKEKIYYSNHNFEMSIINGMTQHDVDLHVLTVPAISSFPYKNKRLFTRAEHYTYRGATIDGVGFCNLWPVFIVFQALSLLFAFLKAMRKLRGKDVHLIVNAPTAYMQAGLWIAYRLMRKPVTKTLILPDVPFVQFRMDGYRGWRAAIKRSLSRMTMKMMQEYDKYVFLTDPMKEFFSRKDLQYIVMEGIVDTDALFPPLSCNAQKCYPQSPSSTGKVSQTTAEGTALSEVDEVSSVDGERCPYILYTGSLNRIFGVMNLVEAFRQSSIADAYLCICGSGDCAEEIAQTAKADNRIVFKGLVPPAEALELQRSAAVLVNPRTSEGDYTKYSFPSKTLEYLLTGRPVIINRLPGIPDEYYQYVFTPEDESVASLRKCIEKVLSLSVGECNSFCALGREFVLRQKNSKVQTARILNLINR